MTLVEAPARRLAEDEESAVEELWELISQRHAFRTDVDTYAVGLDQSRSASFN